MPVSGDRETVIRMKGSGRALAQTSWHITRPANGRVAIPYTASAAARCTAGASVPVPHLRSEWEKSMDPYRAPCTKGVVSCKVSAKGGEKMPELKALSDSILHYRHSHHETQESFAHHCGLSVEEISLLERMKSDPKLSTLQSIAACTGRTVSALLMPGIAS